MNLSEKIQNFEDKIICITGCTESDIRNMRSNIRKKLPYADTHLEHVLYVVKLIYNRTWQCGETVETATQNVLAEL